MSRPRPGGRHQRTGDLLPVRKVAAGGIGGAAATLLLWLVDLTGADVPATVAAAITLLVTAGISYVVPAEGRSP